MRRRRSWVAPQRCFALPIPVQRESRPYRLGVMQDGLERGQTFSKHARTTDGVLGAGFGRLVKHRGQAKRGNERDMVSDTMQPQFEDAVSPMSLSETVGSQRRSRLTNGSPPPAPGLLAFSQLFP